MKRTIFTMLLLWICVAAFGAESGARKPTKEFREYHRIVAKYLYRQPDSIDPVLWKVDKCDADKLRKLERAITRDERLAIMYRVFTNKKNTGFILRPAPVGNPKVRVKASLPLIPQVVVIDGKARDIDLVGFRLEDANVDEWSRVLKIPADDIKSIEYLGYNRYSVQKYGDKAGNGVIIVTTKSGAKNKSPRAKGRK